MLRDAFHKMSNFVSEWVGSPWAFAIALGVVITWSLTGPLFHFSDTWQLVINTSTTIVTFLMVFLIQATQNRESRATQLKLDELIRAVRHARNEFANLEDASEEDLQRFHEEFKRLRAKGTSQARAAEISAHEQLRHKHGDH